MKITNIVLVLASWGGWFVLERWTNLIGETLDVHYPYLIDGIIIVIFTVAGILWWYDHTKNSPKVKKHAIDIVKAVKIISAGHYGEDDSGQTQFMIPYPFDKYIEEEHKEKYPTVSDINDTVDSIFNNPNPYETQERLYDFVPLNGSDEAKFDWALQHLQSYKNIKTKFIKLKEIHLKNKEFHEKNPNESRKIYIDYMNTKKATSPILDEWKKHVWELQKAQNELRDDLEFLYQRIEHDESIKGNCVFCKSSLSKVFTKNNLNSFRQSPTLDLKR